MFRGLCLEVLYKGVLVLGSLSRESLSGSSLYREVAVQGGLCAGDICSGGSLSRGEQKIPHRDPSPLRTETSPMGRDPSPLRTETSPMGRDPPYHNEWAVCILLECILVLSLSSMKMFRGNSMKDGCHKRIRLFQGSFSFIIFYLTVMF